MMRISSFFCTAFLLTSILFSCTSSQPVGSSTTKRTRSQQPQDEENNPLYVYHWVLTELRGQAVAAAPLGEETYLAFYEDRVEGMGGCNRISGPVEVYADGRIGFGDIVGTRMACSRMQQEIELLNVLAESDAYEIAYEELTLYRRNVPLAVFKADRMK